VIAKQNLILPTAICFAALLVISFSLSLKNKKPSLIINLTTLILILIVAFDLLRFSGKWMPFDPRSLMFPNLPIANELKQLSGFERVMSNMGGTGTIYYRLPALDGYDAVYIKRYGEFVASLSDGKLSESARSVVMLPLNGLYTKQAINLLGIKYIVHKVADGHAPWAFPFWTYPAGTFPTIYNDGVYQVFENTNAFPRAFLVNSFVVENNPQKILDTMFNPNFDLRKEVVLEQDSKFNLSGQGTADINSYSSDKILITTNSTGNNLLFLSDSYYPGWQAFVDGRKTPIYRADFTFRTIFVPSGKHQVEFVYSPVSFSFGVLAAVLGLLTIIFLAVVSKGGLILWPKV
jgi:hypothetical protein